MHTHNVVLDHRHDRGFPDQAIVKTGNSYVSTNITSTSTSGDDEQIQKLWENNVQVWKSLKWIAIGQVLLAIGTLIALLK